MARRHPETQHYFHIVDKSPWPLYVSFSLLALTSGAVIWFHYESSSNTLLLGLFSTILNVSLWWRDVVREGTFEGQHTSVVQKGLRIGFILFIVSEIMFFFAFFWAFFNSSLAPGIELGCLWPPELIKPFNPWSVPLLNTLLLVLSGVTITYAHYSLITKSNGIPVKSMMKPNDNFTKYLNRNGNLNNIKLIVTKLNSFKDVNLYSYKETKIAFLFTLFLGFLFTLCQIMEYFEAPFSISDGVYGTTFFMLTGFHGFHVIIGATFITVCFFRFLAHHFTTKHHLGFEFAAWYWHFVDVVWLFLFLILYVWGGYAPISIYLRDIDLSTIELE